LDGISGRRDSEAHYRRATGTGPIAQCGLDLTERLHAAYCKTIIHRDIEPANIFVTKAGRAKALDFGLAELTSAASANANTLATVEVDAEYLTSPGALWGTVAYIAPERARCKDTSGGGGATASATLRGFGAFANLS